MSFDPTLFAMTRKQELMDEEEETTDTPEPREVRVVPDNAAALIVSVTAGTDGQLTLELLNPVHDDDEMSLASMVVLRAISLLEMDIDEAVSIAPEDLH